MAHPIILKISVKHYEIVKSIFSWDGSAREKRIDLDYSLNDVPGIIIAPNEKQPRESYYLVFQKNKYKELYEFINNKILCKYPSVFSISISGLATDFDDTWGGKVNKSLNIHLFYQYRPFGAHKDYPAYYKSLDYSKVIFENLCSELRLPVGNDKANNFINTQQVGFRVEPVEHMPGATKLNCTLQTYNKESGYKSYYERTEPILIKGITVLRRRLTDLKEYYVLPKDFVEQATNEFLRIAKKHKNFFAIACIDMLYDESNLPIPVGNTNAYILSEHTIEHYLSLSYTDQLGLVIEKKPKGSLLCLYSNDPLSKRTAEQDKPKSYGYDPYNPYDNWLDRHDAFDLDSYNID